MLNAVDGATWLSGGTDTPDMLEGSSIFEVVDFHRVGTQVNNSRSEGAQLIESA